MLRKYKHHCPHHQLEYKHHKRPKHIGNHKPVWKPHHRHAPMYANVTIVDDSSTTTITIDQDGDNDEPDQRRSKGKHHRRPGADESSEQCGDEKKKDDFSPKKKINVKDPLFKSAFKVECATVYNGYNDGGRCFFVGEKPGPWTDVWKQCEERGATLAQIHTLHELTGVSAYLVAKAAAGDIAVWIAMYRNQNAANTGNVMNMNESYWFSTPTTKNSKLSGGNTWARTRVKDHLFYPDMFCYLIHNRNAPQPLGNYNLLGTNPCAQPWKPLCQITHPDQSFTYHPDKCVAEEVVEKSTGKTAKCCAKGCGKFEWCRSFNFKDSTQTCEYFSWTIKDGPKTKVDQDCDHYSYDY